MGRVRNSLLGGRSGRGRGGILFRTGEQMAARRRGGTSEQQNIQQTGATAGNFKLTFAGQQTANIAFNANAAAVQAALEALPNLDPGEITVGGGPMGTGAVTILFTGRYARTDVPLLTVDNTGMTGGNVTVSVATPGITTYGPDPETISSFVGPSSFASPQSGPPIGSGKSSRVSRASR